MQILEAFETRGLIHFAEVEPSNRMQVALSLVFGPLKDHPVEAVDKFDPATHPRSIYRTTIRGDYGLGRFEDDSAGGYKHLARTY